MNSLPHLPVGLAIVALLAAGCATSDAQLPMLNPIGPLSGMPFRLAKSETPGQLQVYTFALSVNDGDIIYNPNTPYDVFDADGKFVVHVRNSINVTDQVAEYVSLRGGLYFVRARGAATGTVIIPVLIMPEQLTFANIQQLGRPRYFVDSTNDWVFLPGGWPVGRKAVFQEGATPTQLTAPPALGK